jgi:hypothetical protein
MTTIPASGETLGIELPQVLQNTIAKRLASGTS